MKLAMVTTYATPTNMRRELLETVAAGGHEITVIAPEPAERMEPALASFGARYRHWKVDRTGIDPVADLRSVRALYSIFRSERPDVVLVYQIKAVLLAPTAAKLARVPRVVALINGLGAVFDDYGFGLTWKAKLARFIYGLSLHRVDHIVFQNQDDPQLLQRAHILDERASWCVVPGTGVDVARFAKRPPHEGEPTFTLVSRLLVSKGIREFVAAARIVRQRHPRTRFVLVGQLEAAGHPDAIGAAEVQAWVAEGLIEYLGFTDDIAGVLQRTTVFVLPSYYREGVPRTNLEALATGRPIVTTDWVGCRDTVEDGRNGFLVPVKDSIVLSERLERYLQDPGLAVRHGDASRLLSERKFDIRRVNSMMVDALGLTPAPVAAGTATSTT